ncbi:MAG: NADH:ubiquinone reductase (Na(+)-transporting) subunit E [Chitinivibrionales bacterium]|nr:NADH:ubiquinone reductase (Na(+)-transporting) subunit E [Chitinivibrionales bacterium]
MTVVLIFISASFTDNILLVRFLGMCSCIGISKKVDTSIGLGAAVIFVTAATAALNYLVFHYVLVPLQLEYLRFLTFIIVIAAFTQLVEMVVDRYSPVLYNALGIFLPLITVNCAILGISLFMLNKPYGFIQTFFFGLGGGFGWFLAITLIGGIREKMDEKALPKGLAGPAITLIIIGIMSLAFVAFSGMIKV